MDNITAFNSNEYNQKIIRTVPYYTDFAYQICDIVGNIVCNPKKWLDIGCGTGNMISKIAENFSDCRFSLADISEQMLEIAKKNIISSGNIFSFECISVLDMEYNDCFDVVTSVMVNHFLAENERQTATDKIYRSLNTGGVYIFFENIQPLSDCGTAIGLERWKKFQIDNGKSPEAAEKHIARFGVNYFPVTVLRNLEILKNSGFEIAEIFWLSYMQAGFYAIKY